MICAANWGEEKAEEGGGGAEQAGQHGHPQEHDDHDEGQGGVIEPISLEHWQNNTRHCFFIDTCFVMKLLNIPRISLMIS